MVIVNIKPGAHERNMLKKSATSGALTDDEYIKTSTRTVNLLSKVALFLEHFSLVYAGL